MGKKFAGENGKVKAARGRKEAAKAEKDEKERQVKEQTEAKKWGKGAKDDSKKQSEQAKRQEKLERKREADRLLADEEKKLAKPKAPAPKSKHTPARGTQKTAAAREERVAADELQHQEVKPLNARTLDEAIMAMELVEEPSGAAEAGGSSTGAGGMRVDIDRHPERRFKRQLEIYKDRNLARIKADHPGLRQRQAEDIAYKEFLKSPDNPFRQVHAAYNASSQDLECIAQSEKDKLRQRLEDTD
ncbi:hypothetical protein GGF46_002070 [Coemansia sp. RSA 552]|nr:hypothetical protein GGF46_002070 [Coemansia sp. RSA 552]